MLDDVEDSSFMIKQLVDLDGAVLLSDVSTSEDFEDHLIEQTGDLFDGSVPEEEYEGFMGTQPYSCFQEANTCILQGPTATHWYRKAVCPSTRP